MEEFRDNGTDGWDDILVRGLPDLAQNLKATAETLRRAQERFVPGSFYLRLAEQEFFAAQTFLTQHQTVIRKWRSENRGQRGTGFG